MNENAKGKIEFLIQDNLRAIKSKHPKIALKADPNILEQDKKKSAEEIALTLPSLQKHLDELLPFIQNLRKHIQDITEQTHICAAYLLLARATQDWKSLLSLAEKGDIGCWSFIRLIKESVALADLFALESRGDSRKYIEKWFSGQIIGHAAYREVQTEFMRQDPSNAGIDIEAMATELYQMESLVIHASYSTMLESVSPFTEDFDYTGRTQYSRTSKALGYAHGTMVNMNIVLKSVYLFLIKDSNAYEDLDKILIKYSR
ncbi:MAG: hypothetical protein Q7S04_02995 [Candidatus Moranbacteria bacterium]|nr:hypothetical protein [Candidatus Moranbacteria bacterium]